MELTDTVTALKDDRTSTYQRSGCAAHGRGRTRLPVTVRLVGRSASSSSWKFTAVYTRWRTAARSVSSSI